MSIRLLFSILLPSCLTPCMHVIHMHLWRVAELAEEEMDGGRPVVCYRQAQIHNLWRKKKIQLCLVSHVKAYILYVSLLLVLSSRSHTDISSEDQNPQSKGCFFDLYLQILYTVAEKDMTISQPLSVMLFLTFEL